MKFINKILGYFRFVGLVLWMMFQFPLLLISCWSKWFAKIQLFVFLRVSCWLFGVRTKVYGKVSKKRPLMLVSNHISYLDMLALGGYRPISFFGKAEIKSWPFLGWAIGIMGIVFVDRRPSHVQKALANVQNTMSKTTVPMGLYPEGTTTNGTYVKEFKSALFNFLEPQLEGNMTPGAKPVSVQPMVVIYRHKDGRAMSEDEIKDYAWFDNAKVEFGPKNDKDRGLFEHILFVMKRGGFLTEYHFLDVVDLSKIHNRKELADRLQEIISKKFDSVKKSA